MPIKELQQRLTQVGVIRLGEQRISKNNKPYPAKLDTFRVTSPSKALIDAVAGLYGGNAQEWPEGPGGQQWQVTTNVTQIPVFVLPQKIDPNMEMWGPGFRSRMCDGETERIRNCPCICDEDRQQTEARGETWVRDGRKHCKPTTRLSVMLADVPSLGTWKVESHGWNAAAELPTLTMAILSQAGRPVPAMLEMKFVEDRRLGFKNGKEELETFKFAVPHLNFDGLGITPRLSLGGGVDAVVGNAIGSGPQRQAIGAASEDVPAGQEQQSRQETARRQRPAQTAPVVDWRTEIAGAKTPAALNRLQERMKGAGVSDPALVEAWMARKAEIEGATGPAQTASQPVAQSAPPADDAEVAEVEPDMDVIWGKILKVGDQRGWNLTAIEERYRAHMGHDPNEEEVANGFKYADFLTAVENGQVQ